VASLKIDDVAVADVVLVNCDARMRTAQQLNKPGLPYLDRQPAQVLAVDFEQGMDDSEAAVRAACRERVRARMALCARPDSRLS
jgi:hypothetical protein